jgi:hypothetical protein
MSNFKSWTRDALKDRFGLERTIKHPVLQEWLGREAGEAIINDFEKQSLLFSLQAMLLYVDYWNEEEVKLKFIGNLILLTQYDTRNLSAFADRSLEGTVDGEFMQGNPDFMVARGKQVVKSPFFFIHEYKKEIDNNSQDPAGQLLAAMLVAYEQNLVIPELKEKPLYGAYVVGRYWYFVILQGREYAISLSYDSTHEDQLFDIFRILKANRQKIREIWGE